MGQQAGIFNDIENIWIHSRLIPEQMASFSVMDRLNFKAGTPDQSCMDISYNFSGHGETITIDP